MIVRCIRALFLRSTPQFSLRNCTHFHSSSSNPRFSNSFVDDDEGGSAVYRLAIKFQRPTTVKVQHRLRNHVSFIGTVDRPLKVIRTIETDDFGVHTLLNVESPQDSDSTFKILLKMWKEMGEMCVKHVKPGDFIYVSGCLGSYSKVTEDGQLRLCYEVIVKELNYVARHGQRSSSQKYKELQSVQDVGEAGMERYESQLYLWQVFFTNPFEWWDNRKSKKNPRQPDFRHKDTGEALWLNPNDPPWIKKQLELLDSKLGEGLGDQVRSHYGVSEWVFEQYDKSAGLEEEQQVILAVH